MDLNVVLVEKVFDVLAFIFDSEEYLFDPMFDIDILELLWVVIFTTRRLI
jgi:hypothetical protein